MAIVIIIIIIVGDCYKDFVCTFVRISRENAIEINQHDQRS